MSCTAAQALTVVRAICAHYLTTSSASSSGVPSPAAQSSSSPSTPSSGSPPRPVSSSAAGASSSSTAAPPASLLSSSSSPPRPGHRAIPAAPPLDECFPTRPWRRPRFAPISRGDEFGDHGVRRAPRDFAEDPSELFDWKLYLFNHFAHAHFSDCGHPVPAPPQASVWSEPDVPCQPCALPDDDGNFLYTPL